VRNFLRTETKKVVDRSLSSKTRINRLIAGWRTDPKFLNRNGRPKALEVVGAKSEFSTLARRYGRDVTARTLLDQLLRQRLALERRGKVTLVSRQATVQQNQNTSFADLRHLLQVLDEFDWQFGRRTYSSVAVSLTASENKSAQLIRRTALKRLTTTLRALSALPHRGVSPENGASASRHRVLVKVTITAETKEKAK
jgi:hypothetical protein